MRTAIGMNQSGEFEQLLSQAVEARLPLADALSDLGGRPISSTAEALAICDAAPKLAAIPKSSTLPHSGLHYLTVFFQQAQTAEAFEVLREHGLPFLCHEFDARIEV